MGRIGLRAGRVAALTRSGDGTRWRLPERWRPRDAVFAFHEDTNANAVLITPHGEVYAVAEERLSRKKFQAGFPALSLAWLEQASGICVDDAPVLVFGNRTHFIPRVLGTHFPSFDHDFFGTTHKLMLCYQHLCYSSPRFAAAMERFNRALLGLRLGKPAVILDHHTAHAASAYYGSGRREACAITVDNYGDGYSAGVFHCEGPDIRFVRGVPATCSPGQFYGEMAQLAGIAPMQAGKLTGMAASGDPGPLIEEVRAVFDVTPDGRGFSRTLGLRRSTRTSPWRELVQADQVNLAATTQLHFEDALLAFVQQAAQESGRRDLVLAGGCFANVRLNQRVLELPCVDSVHVHPAMTDQGIAMGAALAYIARQNRPAPFSLKHVFLGPELTEGDMVAALEGHSLPYTRPDDLPREAARLLSGGAIIARVSGPMEYGLRALGNRSLLYQTQDVDLQAKLNAKLRRASYMPFAPMTMAEHAAQCYVDADRGLDPARFMTISFHATEWMKEHSPGVVHVDGTVRPQILLPQDNPGMHRILEEYHRITGNPSLLNTSFNMHGEPIVATADDACRSFVRAGLDYLILGPFLATQA